MSYALKGLKILDFLHYYSPFATLYLADMGAEVVHIESPARPDLVRLMPPFAHGQATTHNYLKKQTFCRTGFKNPQHIKQIKSRIADYDIVVEQFRPGVMQQLGLDYQHSVRSIRA